MIFKSISQFISIAGSQHTTKKEFRHFRHIPVHYRLHARITSCRNHDRHLCLQSYKQNQKVK